MRYSISSIQTTHMPWAKSIWWHAPGLQVTVFWDNAVYSPYRACSDEVPSSLDLLNSVVRECRAEAAEIRRLVPPPELQPAIAEPGSKIQESGNPAIWKSRNLEFWKSGIQKIDFLFIKIKK